MNTIDSEPVLSISSPNQSSTKTCDAFSSCGYQTLAERTSTRQGGRQYQGKSCIDEARIECHAWLMTIGLAGHDRHKSEILAMNCSEILEARILMQQKRKNVTTMSQDGGTVRLLRDREEG